MLVVERQNEATMKTLLRHTPLICVLLLPAASAIAELVNFEIIKTESPYFDGRSFGDVGQYEMITARATIAVDPGHRLNAGIVDINLASKTVTVAWKQRRTLPSCDPWIYRKAAGGSFTKY